MKLLGVYGASGCGRGVMPLVRAGLAAAGERNIEAVFIDDAPPAESINGHRILTLEDFVGTAAEDRAVCVAIADPCIRERVVGRCREAGLAFFSARAGNVVVMDEVELGEGAVLSPFVTLTSNIRIGRHFHANLYACVEHDCIVGDFVTFAPGVRCNGNVIVGDRAYVGAGALLRQGRPGAPLVIGPDAVVGMGAVVTRDVAPGTTVVGNPARVLERG